MVKKPTEKESLKFITLLTKLEKKIKKLEGRPQPMPTPMSKDKKPPKIHGHWAWKFDNPDNKETMKWSGQTFRWCSKDCNLHSK